MDVFLLLDGLPSKVYESHLPGAAGFKATETRLGPFFTRAGQDMDLVSYQRLYETNDMESLNRLWELISTQPLPA